MGTAISGSPDHPQAEARRGALLRAADWIAEWQMRHSLEAISRGQRTRATITGVTQPSSMNECSSIRPCDR